MSIVIVKDKYQVVIPQRVRRQLGISRGDVLEARVEHGKLIYTVVMSANLKPKLGWIAGPGSPSGRKQR